MGRRVCLEGFGVGWDEAWRVPPLAAGDVVDLVDSACPAKLRYSIMVTVTNVYLERKTDEPDYCTSDWPPHLLSFLVSHIPADAIAGALYAELESSSKPIRFFWSSGRERMLTKNGNARQVAQCDLWSFLKYLRYINNNLLGEESGNMGCGILRISFNDDGNTQLFRIFAGVSSKIGCFFQFDLFRNHM
jgi:hypothetical protein